MRSHSRLFNVIHIVEQLREAHPELRQPMTWPLLQRVLERESIKVVRAPIRQRAYIDGGDGTFVITVRSGLDPRWHRRVIAHEYAHAKLHLTERGEVVRQLYPCLKGDPREVEAELFSILLRLGPDATPDRPDVAKLVAQLEAPRFAPPAAKPQREIFTVGHVDDRQQPQPGPLTAAQVKEIDKIYADWYLGRRGNLSRKWRRVTNEPVDEGRIHYVDDKVRFEDEEGRIWTVCDAAPQLVKGSWTVRPVKLGTTRPSHRFFISGAGERRVYVFRNGRELRDVRVSHLDRQLREAIMLAPKALVRTPRTSQSVTS